MTAPIRIVIAGALGRMGIALAVLVEADPGLTLAARFDRPELSGDGLVSANQAFALGDVVIDFTNADASAALAVEAAGRGVALVLGSTGFSPDHLRRISEAAKRVPIVRAGNFSLGLNMLLGLVAQTARALPAEAFDIEVSEAHHRHKIDAPSGAALMLGAAAASGRGVALDAVARRTRDGITGARSEGEIGFSVLRGGGIVGDHSVTFAGTDEILTLSHSARDRGLFARGAVAAAKWVAGKPPGEYDMQDVLGLKGL